ncbi:hypothetical protein CANINC_002510 [Pichia inconspicua]|uniref:MICOS complex subunit n=1 Tax=Pichia inconspicua TaxID=52247 RepID=A0A4T0X1B2_9ASCO|nr:hypothetical protein CANINC_002510 [[Candida] inconspicua]
MARSFYNDEEQEFATPGLPAVPYEHVQKEPISRTTELQINKNGNLITSAPALESFVSKIRETTVDYYQKTSERLDYFFGTGRAHMAMTVDRIAEFKDEKEDLLPNICGVFTATLVGSIMTRTRIWPVRFIVPTTFGVVALKYALPGTYNNIANAVGNVYLNIEERKFPEFKNTRTQFSENYYKVLNNACELKKNAWNSLVGEVATARKTLSEIKKD